MSDCGIGYSEASLMTAEEIAEANAALDIVMAERKGGRK